VKIPSPYRSLPAERRRTLLTHALSTQEGARGAYAQRIVKRGGGYRAVTLMAWPLERLAREVVRLNAETAEDEADLLRLLYVEVEPEIQVAFLDATGVKHEGGVIPEDLQAPYADAEAVAKGASTVRERFGEEGVRYLRTLARYNTAAWPGIIQLAGRDT
jgi:hypothetical protein